MIPAPNGDLYGVNYYGGTGGGNGVFFRMTPSGTYTVLYNFCSQTNCTDGANPLGLVRANDGNFYGVTAAGGTNSCPYGGCGTIFKLTPSGALTTLHNFDGTDGDSPESSIYSGHKRYLLWNNSLWWGRQLWHDLRPVRGLTRFVKTLPTSGEVGATIQS